MENVGECEEGVCDVAVLYNRSKALVLRVRNLGAFKNERHLKCWASTYPSGKMFDLDEIRLIHCKVSHTKSSLHWDVFVVVVFKGSIALI